MKYLLINILFLIGCSTVEPKNSELGWARDLEAPTQFYIFEPAYQSGAIQTPAFYTNTINTNIYIKRDESFFDAIGNSNKPAYFIKI